MIADLKPYPAMKDSGVPWLGEVPEHWEVRRLGQIGRLSKGVGGSKDDEELSGVPCVRYGDLYTTHTFFIEMSRSFVSPATAKTYTAIRFGDVLFAASGETIDDIGKSAVNLIQSAACCGGAVILFRPERALDPRYIGYATDCRPAAAQKAAIGRGITVKHIYSDQLRYLTIALPPLPEQSAIARFLDLADRRIRRYVRAKQKLIKLLEEQKQAVIHRAVTRGLDANVRLKPSGIEWLGEVPEHWEIRRNGRLFAQRNETGFAGLPILEVSLKTGVRVRDFKDGTRKQVMFDHDRYKKAAAGDIAYNMMRMWQGAVGIAPTDGLVSPAYVVARPLDSIDVGYYEYLFRTTMYMREVNNCSRGIVQDRNRLYWEDFKQIPSPFPPLEEQKRIADTLVELSRAANDTINKTNATISLLREYRTRLIADVVTGKLDVRAAAASLPDEADAPEAPDDTGVLAEGDEAADDDLDAATEEAEA